MFPPIETPDDMMLFFAPLLQVDAPPPDSFDEEEFGEVEFDWPLEQPEIEYILSTLYEDPTPSMTTGTYSTEYSQDSASQYSIDFNQSDYSIPSDVAPNGPGVYNMHNSHSPDIFYGSSSSSAHSDSDYGTSEPSGYRLSFELFDLARTMQDVAITVPPAHVPVDVVDVTPDAQANTARAPRPFKCPYCSFSSARKYNLKTHIGTHDKERSKKFACGICMRGFSRKHDLQRHQTSRHGRGHGDQRSLLSARTNSARASEPSIGSLDEITAWIPGV